MIPKFFHTRPKMIPEMTHISSSISKLCYLNLHLYNVPCFMSVRYLKSLIFNQRNYLSSYKAHNHDYSKIQFRVPKPEAYMV